MGHNVDLGAFGLCNLKCQRCKEELDLSEVDIDCDVHTHHPMQFEMELQCSNCQETNKFVFDIIEEEDCI